MNLKGNKALDNIVIVNIIRLVSLSCVLYGDIASVSLFINILWKALLINIYKDTRVKIVSK